MKNKIITEGGRWLGLTLLLLLTITGLKDSSAQTDSTSGRFERFFSPVGGKTLIDNVGLQLEASSLPPSPLTKQAYLDAYNEAQKQLNLGIKFRATELQRLDPSTCQSDPNNLAACSFSPQTLENNYLDFKNGRLYWRFCADYDEPFVGEGNWSQTDDDKDNRLQINSYGYCPEWSQLSTDQQNRRVSASVLEAVPLTHNPDNPTQPVEIDIRNQMIDAQRTFAILAIAEPADLTFWIDADDPTKAAALEPDGDRDTAILARDIGIEQMLLTTREVASIHLIFGNEFMVDALRFPIGAEEGTNSLALVEGERAKLLRALHQYELATKIFFNAMNFNLRTLDQEKVFSGDYFTDEEFALFTKASEQTVTTLGEVAKRDRLLGRDGDQEAVERLDEALVDQYLQGMALAAQAERLVADDPETPNVDESVERFLNNGGFEILNNIRQLVQQAENIRGGLNPLGYDPSFVPLQDFETLFELTCGDTNAGGTVACNNDNGLLAAAAKAEDDLRSSQREFDQNFDLLQTQLSNLQSDYDTILTDICGPSTTDANGDDLIDYAPCGFFDRNENGIIDGPSETAGLIGDNYWELLAAGREVSLAKWRVESKTEEIREAEQDAGKVIGIILSEGVRLSAYELAIGKLNAFRTTSSSASSSNITQYDDESASITAGNKTTIKLEASFLGAFTSGVSNETYVDVAVNKTTGTRIENSIIETTETVWSPTDLRIAQFNSINQLAEAEANATIESIEREAQIRQLLREQTELLKQVELAQIKFNQVANAHNSLVSQYTLALTQRAGTQESVYSGYVAKPYYRLFRDEAALEASRTLERAQQAAYLAAKALEYHTLSPIPESEMQALYRVRNTENLEAFLFYLSGRYLPVQPNDFSLTTYRFSLAEDLLGLSDANLNPHGLLTEEEVETVRTAQFQEILAGGRISNPETGFERIVIPFSTSLDNRRFSNNIFNQRISGVEPLGSQAPGCRSGCRGVWLNIITDQEETDFGGSLPKIGLTHAGAASYLNSRDEIVRYDPASARFLGFKTPDGFGTIGLEKDDITTHINLPPGANPNQFQTSDDFHNLSVATTQWAIEIDLTAPFENTQLDLSQIKDIELSMDVTFVTKEGRRQLADLDLQRVAAETAGLPVPPELNRAIQTDTMRLEKASDLPVSRQGGEPLPEADPNRYTGTATILDPAPLGTLDIGFSLEIGPDNRVSGTLCHDCGPLFQAADPVADGEGSSTMVPISGTFNPADRSVTFTTGEMIWALAGRTAIRTWRFDGTLSASGDVLQGTYAEEISGFVARPIVSEGTFLVSRPLAVGTPPLERQLLVGSSAPQVEKNGSIEITVLLRDGFGTPIPGIETTLTTDRGTLSEPSGTTDGNGELTVTFTAGDETGRATITAQADGLTESRTILIVISRPPLTNRDEAEVDAGQSIEIDVLANDSASEGELDRSSVTVIEQPGQGSVSVDSTSGVITYLAASNGNGGDRFTYVVSTEDGVRSAATEVLIVIKGKNPVEGLILYMPMTSTK